MIDTDKYEGHTPAPWTAHDENYEDFADIDAGPTRIASLLLTSEHLEFNLDDPTDTPEHHLKEMWANTHLMADSPLLLAEVKRLREDYEKMSEVLRQHGMDICRHCRVIYRDDEISDYNPKNHPHYPSLHPWHMDGMCMKEMIE